MTENRFLTSEEIALISLWRMSDDRARQIARLALAPEDEWELLRVFNRLSPEKREQACAEIEELLGDKGGEQHGLRDYREVQGRAVPGALRDERGY